MPDWETLSRLRQDKFDEAHAHVIRIKNDIQWFSSATESLIAQIQRWTRGPAIELLRSDRQFHDRSIILWPDSSPACYSICTLFLQSRYAVAELIPRAVYGRPGSRGTLLLRVMDPGNKPLWLHYILTLDRVTACWMIHPESVPWVDAARLDKATFRAAVSSLYKQRDRS